jgi:hypothetical protein
LPCQKTSNRILAGAAYGGPLRACQPAPLTKATEQSHERRMSKATPPSDKSREERLAEALRENLRKRKAQARDSATETSPVKASD